MEAGSDSLSEALRHGDDLFRLAFDNAPIGMAIVGLDFRLQLVNRSLCDTLGYSEKELISRSFVELTYPNDIDKDVTLAGQLFKGEIPNYRLEKRFLTKDGRVVWIDLTALVVRGKSGEVLYGLALAEDISERKQDEAALRENEVRYRSFIVNSSEGIWRFEAEEPIDTSLPSDQQIELFFKHAYLAECNDAMARMYGHICAEEIIGSPLADLLPASDPGNIASARRFIEDGYRIQDVVSVEMDKDGHRRYFMNNVAGVVENGFLLRAWGTQQDITERRRAEDQLRESRQQLRALAARIEALREEERAAISREIHDVLGQGLTSLKIDISQLYKKLPDIGDETARGRIAERYKAVIELLDETLATVKNLCTELRPRLLDTFGLSAAVEWQCAEFQRRSGIVCECRLPDDELSLSAELSIALFRILQEALTNVTRHSQATKVHIELDADDKYVCLSVRDNGRGVTEEEIAGSRSLGLLGMRERAALFGGEVVVIGKPNRGTTVTARIPFNSSEQS